METCGEVHSMLIETISGLKGNINELYSLNRETSKDSADIKERLSSVETKLDAWHEESERQQQNLTNILSTGLARIEKLAGGGRSKWGPTHTVALITGCIGPGGVLAIIMFFAKGGS